MKKKFQLAIWDIDGTIADSLGPTVDVFHEELEAHFGRPILESVITAQFGLSEFKMIENIVGPDHAHAVYERVRTSMQSRMGSLVPYPGVETALRNLKNAGFKLAVYTGRGREGATFILKTLKLHDLFDLILTNDDVKNPKPHPEGVSMACQTLQISPSEAFMIGDSHMDIEAAIGAGTFAVGCTWDNRSTAKSSLQAGNAIFVSSADELLNWLSKFI